MSNDGARHFFSHHELENSNFGGYKKQRLGTESKLPFGYCCLSLTPCNDPVVTLSGHIYEREAILTYLLEKKMELKEKYNEKMIERERAQEMIEKRNRDEKNNEIKKFIESETLLSRHLTNEEKDEKKENNNKKNTNSLLSRLDQYHNKTSHTIEHENINRGSRVAPKKSNLVGIEGRKDGIERTSFWSPEYAPDNNNNNNNNIMNPEDILSKSPPELERPRSPMSNNILKRKEIYTLPLELDDENQHYRYICPVSKTQITSQDVIFIKKTGAYMLKNVYDEIVKPTMRCPITNKRFKNKDIILIRGQGTSFSASGNVMVKKHRIFDGEI